MGSRDGTNFIILSDQPKLTKKFDQVTIQSLEKDESNNFFNLQINNDDFEYKVVKNEFSSQLYKDIANYSN
jgi:hypothetical protein